MTNSPYISVIIPAYNCSNHLVKAIHSVQRQKSTISYEIIVVDDGSTDNTAAVALGESKLDKSIRVYTQINKGPSEARNRGIDLAKGIIALFLDSDDMLGEYVFETVASEFREHPKADLVSFDFDVCEQDGSLTSSDKLLQRKYVGGRLLRGEEALDNLHRGSLGNFLWMYAYRISYIKKLGIRIPKQFGVLEDAVYMNQLFMSNPTIWCSEARPLYHYVMVPSSITHTSRTNKAKEALRAVEAIESTSRSCRNEAVYLVRLLLFAGSLVDVKEKESATVLSQVACRIKQLLPKTRPGDFTCREMMRVLLIISGQYIRVKSVKS